MENKDKLLILISVVGLILIICALYLTIPSFTGEKEIKLNDFTMSAQSYNSIVENFGEEQRVLVCNMDSNDCVFLWNIDNLN